METVELLHSLLNFQFIFISMDAWFLVLPHGLWSLLSLFSYSVGWRCDQHKPLKLTLCLLDMSPLFPEQLSFHLAEQKCVSSSCIAPTLKSAITLINAHCLHKEQDLEVKIKVLDVFIAIKGVTISHPFIGQREKKFFMSVCLSLFPAAVMKHHRLVHL